MRAVMLTAERAQMGVDTQGDNSENACHTQLR
jgi:hypothetical protein